MKVQRGNILFLILLAVVLFAALSYAVTQSTRGGGNDASNESSQAKVAELSNYFTQLDTAVQRMMLTGGVKDYELDFYYQSNNKYIGSTFDNTNCTSSACHVFDPVGGAVGGKQSTPFIRDPTYALTNKPVVLYLSVPGVGTDKPDIVMMIQGLTWGICREFNKKAGLSDVLFNVSEVMNSNTHVYGFGVPVGAIPDTTTTLGVAPAVGSLGTFCVSLLASQAAVDSNAIGYYWPMVYHVILAR